MTMSLLYSNDLHTPTEHCWDVVEMLSATSHFQPVSILQEGEARVRWNGILLKIAEGESDQELSGHTSFEVFRH